mgnify:CR=1 FL=1
MTDDSHLQETPVARTELLRGHFLHVVRDTVRLPSGAEATREFVLHPGAVMVIGLLDDGKVVLERQFRHPMQAVMIEFPAGKLDAGDLMPSVTLSLTRAGFRTRLIQRGTWATASGLGSAYPALAPMKDGSWVILIVTMSPETGPVAAILDPAQEGAGVQTMPRAEFLARWSGRLLLVQRKPELK